VCQWPPSWHGITHLGFWLWVLCRGVR
jgi:hypothetical protein